MRLVVLISGSGSNLQAILDAARSGRLDAQVELVVSNRKDAYGLVRAAQAAVPTLYFPLGPYTAANRSRDEYDADLAQLVAGQRPDLVVLAGFMRILTDNFVLRYQGRMLNIHPSLLPAFPGLDTHARALAAGVKLHGCTVHYVTADLDHGPIVIQASVPVLPHDDEAQLAARVLVQEHRIYPQAARWFLDGTLAIEGGVVRVSGGQAQQLYAP